jgi:alanyl-tRNA synthetase
MTYKLFYDNAYIGESISQVNEIIEKDNKVFVVLNKTPFYPEGGGQPSDIGTIDGIKVTHVYEDEDIIYHVVDRKPENREVHCKVNLNRRIDYMVQHSGEHLLSAAFYKLYNGINCGFHMGEDYSTADINIKDVSEEMVSIIEEEVNNYIYLNAPVSTYTVSKQEAQKLPMRKEVKIEDNVRIVQIGGLDYSACCGVHVVRSGEIGILKIIKVEKYKGMTRVYFKCGKRALKDYMNKHNIVTSLVKFYSIEESGILSQVETQAIQIKHLNRRISEYRKVIAAYDAEELIRYAEGDIVVKIYKDKNFEDLQYIADQLNGIPQIFILASLLDNRMLMMQDGSMNISCGKLFKSFVAAYNGKGGGNDNKAQAGFDKNEDMLSFIERLEIECN